MPDILRINISDGKYTFVVPQGGRAHVLRYGEPWLEELSAGANCWIAMAFEIEELRNKQPQEQAA